MSELKDQQESVVTAGARGSWQPTEAEIVEHPGRAGKNPQYVEPSYENHPKGSGASQTTTEQHSLKDRVFSEQEVAILAQKIAENFQSQKQQDLSVTV